MSGELPARRSTRVSNRLIAIGLTVIVLATYALVAYHVKHGM